MGGSGLCAVQSGAAGRGNAGQHGFGGPKANEPSSSLEYPGQLF